MIMSMTSSVPVQPLPVHNTGTDSYTDTAVRVLGPALG